jgi:hypothetical protein
VCTAKKAIEAMLITPSRMITPTAIRMTLSAPLPWPAFAGGTEVAGTGLPVAGLAKFDAGEEASTAAPHLLQNRIPGVRLAPQELQNAINHLMPGSELNGRREYTAD